MILAGIDLETTGFDVESDHIIEIGVVFWDWEKQKPVDIYNELLKGETYPQLPQEITKVTGITQEDLDNYGIHPVDAYMDILPMLRQADYIVAHNGNEFDRPFFEKFGARYCQINKEELALPPWIDTMLDVPYPDECKSRKLGYLAADHGFLNPFPHRAFADVLTMLKILSNYNIEQVVKSATSKTYYLQAVCEKPWVDKRPKGEKETDLAKARGYRWDGDKKIWVKAVKEYDFDQETCHTDFIVKVIEIRE